MPPVLLLGTAGGSGGGCCLLEDAGLSFLFFSSISPRFALVSKARSTKHMVASESLTELSPGEALSRPADRKTPTGPELHLEAVPLAYGTLS
ncbi:hypothetical protein U9M48_000885 [Paspalum notatum var. saurae]|uniref:Uncharacterized protein n=1 Tax=Paspalum notatum var. saurae TaxID=547442 RepID=A0AAQ3PMH7_PASNO